MSNRPGWLTAIGVIAIILGVLGILSSTVSAIGQYFSASMQEAIESFVLVAQQNQMPSEAKALMDDMKTLMKDLQERWRPILLTLLACNMVLSVLLLAGGIGTLRLAEWGRRMLIAAFAGTMLYEVGTAATQLIMQFETRHLTSEYTAKMMDAMSKGNQAMPPAQRQQMMRVMTISTSVFFLLGVAMGLAWLLVKLIAYGLAIHYLRRPQIRALVANRAGPAEVQAIAVES
jgi:hypothetical protein